MGLFEWFKNKNKIENYNTTEETNYIKETPEYILEICNDILDDETLKYSEKIIEKYLKEKNKILEYYLDIELREFYNKNFGYTDEYIKENLGRPHIIINFKNNGNKNWKFNYTGIIDYEESNLDEHLISIEFYDDLIFDNYMQFNG